MGYHYSPHVTTDGLVMYLDAYRYTSGSTIWNDISYSGTNPTTLVNGPTYNTDNLGSIVLDGSNDYLLPPTNIFGSNFNIHWHTTWTIDSWMFVNSGHTLASWYTAYNGGNAATYATPNIYFEGDNLVFEPTLTYRRDFGVSVTAPVSTTRGSWNHFVVTFNGTTLSFYLNGVRRGTTTYNYVNSEWRIGGVYKLIVDGNNKIYACGGFTKYNNENQNFLIRLNPDGTKDTNFNIGSGPNNEVYTMELLPDGKLNIGGSFTSYSGVTTNCFVRLNSSGFRDGMIVPNTSIVAKDMVTTSSGTTYIGSIWSFVVNNTSVWPLFRISGNTIDTTFNNTQTLPKINTDTYYYGLALDSGDNIFAVGSFTTWKGVSANRIVKIDTLGNRMTAFSVGTGFNAIARTIKLDSSGKVLVGGDFTTYSGISINRIVRLNTDGSRDTGFSVGTGFNGSVRTINIDANGKILVGGDFTTYSGISINRLVRLNTDGTIDNTFNIGTGFDQMVNTTAFDSSGNIYVGGNFTSYSGFTCGSIIKLTSSGSIDSTFNSGTGFNRRMERNPTSTLRFGGDGVIASRWFSGRYGSHRIYNRTLTDQEIGQNFSATRGRYGR